MTHSQSEDQFYRPTTCNVVARPDEVPVPDRVAAAFPEQFTVEVTGSADHFAARLPRGIGESAGPPAPSPHLHSESSGVMFADIRKDSDLWLLRHQTTFRAVYQNGKPLDIATTNGSLPRTANIHAQTLKQRSEGATGPQVLLAEGMPDFMPFQESCVCHVDIVGVPMMQSLHHLQYLGRIHLPELEFVGGPITLDHWGNWFFHIFMDTNKSVPTYYLLLTMTTDY